MQSKRTAKEIREIERVFLNKNKKSSIQTLSSIVFGIALSIGTFTFIVSDTKLVTSNIITFAFSFIILIYIWLRYTKVLEVMKVETNLELLLNMVMLFLIVIEPYLFNLVQVSALSVNPMNSLDFTSYLFSLDIAGLMFVLGAIYILAVRDYRDVRREVIGHYDHIRNSLLIIGAMFIISALPEFWGVSVFGVEFRFFLWALSVVAAITLRLAGK